MSDGGSSTGGGGGGHGRTPAGRRRAERGARPVAVAAQVVPRVRFVQPCHDARAPGDGLGALRLWKQQRQWSEPAPVSHAAGQVPSTVLLAVAVAGGTKLALVGRTGSGKSSLADSLVLGRPATRAADDRTVGVDVRRWRLGAGSQVVANVFDAAGQRVYHIMMNALYISIYSYSI